MKTLSLFIVLCFIGFYSVKAQSAGDYQTSATGAWSSSATWQKYDGLHWNAATDYPGQNAIAGTTTILDGAGITLNSTLAHAISNLTVGQGVSGILTLAASTISVMGETIINGSILVTSTSGTKTFQNVTVSNGGTWTSNAAEIYSIAGNFTLSGATITGSANGDFEVAGNFNIATTTSNEIARGTINVTGNTAVQGTLTISGTGGDKTFNGAVSINGGNWINTAGETFAVYNDLTLTNGTITNNANAEFDVGGNLILHNGIIGGDKAYLGTFAVLKDFDITSATANQIGVGIFTVAGNMNIAGTLTIPAKNGAKTINGNFVIIAGGDFENSNNENFTLNGNFENDGTFSSGTGTYSFKGNSVQNIAGLSSITITNLLINNTATGTVVVLSSPVTVSGILTLTQGVVKTDSINVLALSTTASVALPLTDASYVWGTFAHSIASTVTATKVFPVGINGKLHRVDIVVQQANTTATTYTCGYYAGDAKALSWSLPASGINRVSSLGYWHIAKSNESIQSDGSDASLKSAFVTLYYTSMDGVTDPSHLLVAKSNGVTNEWMSGGVGTFTSSSVTSTAYNAFCDFSLASDCDCSNPLPITLVSFAAHHLGSNIIIQWQTASEYSNDFFTLERSVEGTIWNEIYRCSGAGNSTETHYYSFVDDDETQGTVYYRLKQTDINGAFTLSNVISAECNAIVIKQAVFPNPAKVSDVIQIQLPTKTSEPLKVIIIDAVGKQIYTRMLDCLESDEVISLGTLHLLPGIYSVVLIGTKLSFKERLCIIQ